MLIPNNLIKALARLQIHGNQWRLLWIIWDKTDKQKEAYISLPQFSEDTGLPPQLISRELIDLEKRNIIKRIYSKTKPIRYSFQKDHRKWILTSKALERRNRMIRGGRQSSIEKDLDRQIKKDRIELGLDDPEGLEASPSVEEDAGEYWYEKHQY